MTNSLKERRLHPPFRGLGGKERVSVHFSWKELIYSETAERCGIPNVPSPEVEKRLVYLVTGLLQPLRDLLGEPVTVTSGFRCEELNRRVGGVPGSQHVKGEAVDVRCRDHQLLLSVLLESGLVFDQVIVYRQRGFVHLSLKREGVNRKQVLWR